VTRDARLRAGTAGDALTRIAHAYLDFARDNPAVYDAMFTRATTLRFAAQDTPPRRTAAFAELRHAVGVIAAEQDADALTELLWAALHGLVTIGWKSLAAQAMGPPWRPTTPWLRLGTSSRGTKH
jgi:hypothetical protein